MAKYTNTAPGARGIRYKNGTDALVEAGQVVDLDTADLDFVHPDIVKGDKSAKDDTDTDDLIAVVEAENAELKKQNAAQAKEITDLKAENAKLKPTK